MLSRYYSYVRYQICIPFFILVTGFSVDHYPAEDEKLRASKLERRRGGNVPNTLEVLQGLLQWRGVTSRLVLLAVLPDASSSETREIRSSLEPNVDLTHCFYRQSSSTAPSSYIVKSTISNSRTIVNYNDLEEMSVSEFQKAISRLPNRSSAVFHFEGRLVDITSTCIDHVRVCHPEALISVEIEKPYRDGLQELAQKADIVFFSKGWAQVCGVRTSIIVTKSKGHPRAGSRISECY